MFAKYLTSKFVSFVFKITVKSLLVYLSFLPLLYFWFCQLFFDFFLTFRFVCCFCFLCLVVIFVLVLDHYRMILPWCFFFFCCNVQCTPFVFSIAIFNGDLSCLILSCLVCLCTMEFSNFLCRFYVVKYLTSKKCWGPQTMIV